MTNETAMQLFLQKYPGRDLELYPGGHVPDRVSQFWLWNGQLGYHEGCSLYQLVEVLEGIPAVIEFRKSLVKVDLLEAWRAR